MSQSQTPMSQSTSSRTPSSTTPSSNTTQISRTSSSAMRKLLGTNTMDDWPNWAIEFPESQQSPSNADIASIEDAQNVSDMDEDINRELVFQGDGADGVDANPADPMDPADPAGGNKDEGGVVMDMDQVDMDVNVKYKEVHSDKEDKHMDIKVQNKVNVNKEVDKKEDDKVDDEQKVYDEQKVDVNNKVDVNENVDKEMEKEQVMHSSDDIEEEMDDGTVILKHSYNGIKIVLPGQGIKVDDDTIWENLD
eukprot:351210_1